jgi:hypothetical protein
MFDLAIDSKLRGCDACLHAPVCPQLASVDFRHLTRFDGLWRAQHATDPVDIDRQANKDFKYRPAFTWPMKLESPVRYRGIDVDEALEVSEQAEI